MSSVCKLYLLATDGRGVLCQAALHIHCPFAQLKEEMMHNSAHSSSHASCAHPLDSNLTSDVLRYQLRVVEFPIACCSLT